MPATRPRPTACAWTGRDTVSFGPAATAPRVSTHIGAPTGPSARTRATVAARPDGTPG